MTTALQKGNYGSIEVQHPSEQQPLIGSSSDSSSDGKSSGSQSRRSIPFILVTSVVIAGIVALGFHLSSLYHEEDISSLRPLHDTTTSAQQPSIEQVTANAAVSPAVKKKKLYFNTPRFYDNQLVDHFDTSNKATWSQRYYVKRVNFAGPGHPIFLVIGGEGANDVGFFYPFIHRVMAKKFGALVLHPEHRFYGISQPIPDRNASVPELLQLLTPEQSMMDMLRLTQHYQKKFGCSPHKSSKKYCPIITVGGSYPGFLAAMMRLLYPNHIDMAYASSAPMKLYSKDADQWGYYEILTEAAERASPGCPAAVKQALTEFETILQDTTDFLSLAYNELNVCPGSVPKYIDSGALFAQELTQIIETSFADANMIGNYPPSNKTWFAQLCHVFQNDTTTYDKFRNFWLNLEIQDKTRSCFAMDYQMSEGSNATISSADWSGLGPGRDGRMWDFQCCTSLTPEMGFSHKSMFPYRKWTYEWLTEHCVNRFGVVGDPLEMVKQYHFNDLVGQGASRIIFTNGGNDMWMAGSYTQNLSDSIIAIVIPNGGHHSEVYAKPDDLPDVKEAQKEIEAILGGWLQDIKDGKYE